MSKCLGIYIEDDVIKYSKVDKTKDFLKIESSSVVFYEKENIEKTLEKIIRETFSAKDPISINIPNELCNYFEVFSALKKSDKSKSTDLDFELLCSEKGYNKDSLEARYIFRNSRENADRLKTIHISANKENIHRRVQSLGNARVSNVMPISTSIFNLVDLGPKDENVVIVNIENNTKITTILGGEIYHIDTISDGMGEILDKINSTENSMQKSYECCKNTTIYTQEMQDLQMDENDHLEDIMPTLYKIVEEVRRIIDTNLGQITKVYITGLATAINNIDLYFQEYITNAKCELLKPFFLENMTAKMPIKDYIEVNSATALALDGLGYGITELNFKKKNGMASVNVSGKSVGNFFRGLIDPTKDLTAIDKTFLRIIVCLCVGIVGYSVISGTVLNQIDQKKKEVDKQNKIATGNIDKINAQKESIDSGRRAYDQLIVALTSISEEPEDSYNTVENEVVIRKNAIPNLLNRIVNVIPKQVKITSIKNTENKHIVIEAQAEKYDQLGYFRAALSTEGILDNVKSTSGMKSGKTIVITIEGDLP